MIYLDQAATAPLSPAARSAWLEAAAVVGNPSSLHAAGRAARRIVEEARERVAAALARDSYEVIFTAGGTEADNLALLGIAQARRSQDDRRRRVLVSAVEHPAVLEAAQAWARSGGSVIELAVGRDGRVDVAAAAAVLAAEPETIALVSCQWVNHETGAIQPLAQLFDQAQTAGIPCHTDAVQAVAYVMGATPAPADGTSGQSTLPAATAAGRPATTSITSASAPTMAEALSATEGLAAHTAMSSPTMAEALSLSGHKLGAPMGIGALVVSRDAPISPISYGGGQERKLRSGTVPAALCAAFAAALDETVQQRLVERDRLAQLAAYLIAGLARLDADLVGQIPLPDGVAGVVEVTGPTAAALRSPHIVGAVFPGRRADDLLLLLDQHGIACSTGSACTAGVARPSHVLAAMGHNFPQAGLRFSFGATTTTADIDALLAVLPMVVAQAEVVP